jgi:Ca2+-binding EF-hand superfamily protein
MSAYQVRRKQMLTEFQKRKLTVAFHHHDMDNDGLLGQADYERFVKRFCEIQNYPPGSPEYEAMHTQTMAAWEHVRNVADKDGDNQVSLEEFLESYDVTLSDENLSNQLLTGYIKSLLAWWDRDGDGRLSGVEYVTLAGCYGIGEEGAREAFRHLDRNGSGYLTIEELMKNTEEFYLGDDPDAPGNWMLGPY